MRKGISAHTLLLTFALLCFAPGAQAKSADEPTYWARFDQQLEEFVIRVFDQWSAAADQGLEALTELISTDDSEEPAESEPGTPPNRSNHDDSDAPVAGAAFPQIDPNG